MKNFKRNSMKSYLIGLLILTAVVLFGCGEGGNGVSSGETDAVVKPPLHVVYMDSESHVIDCNYWMEHETNYVAGLDGESIILDKDKIQYFKVTSNK